MTVLALLHRWGAPQTAYQRFGVIAAIAGTLGILSLTIALLAGLFWAPADYQQGDAFRIIYVHVPMAFYSMGLFLSMAICGFVYLVWHIKVASHLMRAMAEVGIWVTALALLTGAIWGKPMWGTWWVWDARLTAELILFFLYAGILALYQAIPHATQGQKAASVMALIGALDLPIIHFSVNWWQTLHQGATLSRFAKPAMAPEMLWPLLLALAGFAGLIAFCVFKRSQSLILLSAVHQRWWHALVKGASHGI